MSDCVVDDCGRPAARNGFCHGHAKRITRGQSLSAPIKERPKSPLDRAFEAALAYAEAEDDDDYRRARDNLRKSIAACADSEKEALRREFISLMTLQAMAALKAKGVRLGRPARIAPEVIKETVRQQGSVSKAAAALRLSARQIFRVLRRTREANVAHR